MSEAANSLLLRFARWQVRALVRVWPEETRRWGQALASEVEEIEQPLTAIWWALGGVTVFMRAMGSQVLAWFKMPVGGRGGLGAGPLKSAPGPKRSRVFTAVVLAAAAALFLLPEGREALRTVQASWMEYQNEAWKSPDLRALADRATRESDANALAFVSLSTGDAVWAAQLRQQAMALNPSLIWIYAARNHSNTVDPWRSEELAQLQASDPGNAVPILLEAQALVSAQMDAVYRQGANLKEDRELLRGNPKWCALMERAFAAPRYDSYVPKHHQLVRTVWNRNKNLPATVVVTALWAHAIPNLLNMKNFATIRMEDADKVAAAGDLPRAEELLGGLEAFGSRMSDGSDYLIERLIGFSISRGADEKLAALYSSAGREQDAQNVRSRIQRIDDRIQAARHGGDSYDYAVSRSYRRVGLLVQVFGMLGVLAVFLALGSILLLELWPWWTRSEDTLWRRCLRWTAASAPVAFLASSAAFLLSFLPFQRALTDYRNSAFLYQDRQRVMDAFWGLVEVPQYFSGDDGLGLWTFVTVALTALLLFVIARGIYRTKHTAPTPA
jgi:hypothetical protein